MSRWVEPAIQLAVLVVAVMVHEVAHGLAALWCGDPTARERGRLSLNPLRHIDPLGSILLPALLVLSGSAVVFGWAKPVPVHLGRTRHPRQALWITALAGPLSNLLQALVAAGALRGLAAAGWLTGGLATVLAYVLLINVGLMVFNLLPVPPLDGSRVLAALLPRAAAEAYLAAGRYGFVVLYLLFRAGPVNAAVGAMQEWVLRWFIPWSW